MYLDIVTVASVPENYPERLIERHDLVLARLARNIDRDREDVKRLAAGPGLDPQVLKQRYESELRHQFGRPEREDLTLELWLEMIQEVQQARHEDPAAG